MVFVVFLPSILAPLMALRAGMHPEQEGAHSRTMEFRRRRRGCGEIAKMLALVCTRLDSPSRRHAMSLAVGSFLASHGRQGTAVLIAALVRLDRDILTVWCSTKEECITR